jgi:hypothetical protein
VFICGPRPARSFSPGFYFYSFAWAQPLEAVSQKFTTPLMNIADPIFAPAKREEIVSNLLAAVSDTLAVEEALFNPRTPARFAADARPRTRKMSI